ncbi:unnamed protein product [Caenorhabditis auriculariae]|uniref:Tyrosine-protein kinase n=1 Tax=Caenorhabditis auriculariae TaxID=2777116 RepID=A0A8S1HBK4_9PELO|nr:unnamed protein product [Caenorhabditis auriculariae]
MTSGRKIKVTSPVSGSSFQDISHLEKNLFSSKSINLQKEPRAMEQNGAISKLVTFSKMTVNWITQNLGSEPERIFDGGDRLESGQEANPKTLGEAGSPNQKTDGSKIQKTKEEGHIAYEVEGSEAQKDKEMKGDLLEQKTNYKKEDNDKLVLGKILTDPIKKSTLIKISVSSQPIKTLADRRRSMKRGEVHELLVPEREEKKMDVARSDDDIMEHFIYYHGFLPQLETMRFIRRAGDFLLRKMEDDGKDHLLLSVGVLMEFEEDESDLLDENIGKDQPVRIEDYVVRRDELGVFLEDENRFECLEDLLTFYILHPDKDSLNIKLLRGCPICLFQIRERNIVRIEDLGSGNFGDVFLGEIMSIGILEKYAAVKTVKKDCPGMRKLSEKLIAEAHVMMNLCHENVVEMYGWMIDRKPFKLILEYMPGGSLENYLLKHFDEASDSCLLKFALDAAKGVQYLHENELIHRDVAARNCLLSADQTAKIADLGLTVRGSIFWMKQAETLPTRFLAPETLAIFVFTYASDNYSFGNLLFEIFSGGLMPHEELSCADARKKILDGKTSDLEQTRAPPALRPFIKEKLWAYAMRERAGMDEIVKVLKDTYRSCKKQEGLPRTITNEETGDKEDGILKGVPKKRRREPVNRKEIMEEVVPTQED